MSGFKQYSYELHRPARKNFHRRSVSVSYPNDIWAIDLMNVSNISVEYQFIHEFIYVHVEDST